MKWLDKNPIGLALVLASAAVVAVGGILWFAWTRPVSTDLSGAEAGSAQVPMDTQATWEMGPARDYQVFNDRPLFNETRRPTVVDEPDPEAEETEVVEVEVAKPPRVKLTGVVITPEARLVTLTPEKGGEPLILQEGKPLEGEYVGWSVNAVSARAVNLRSARGEDVSLDLMVYDQTIKEPPKPKRRNPEPSEEDGDQGEALNTEQAMSRAEEIRQRIAERREQLRQQADQEREEGSNQQSERRDAYQSAIQNMLQGGRPDNENEDGE